LNIFNPYGFREKFLFYSPPEAIALILLGLLVKGGVFVPFNLAVIGTAIALSQLIFLPIANTSISETAVERGYWLGVSILMGGLIATNLIYPQAYTIANISKVLITFAIGALTINYNYETS